MQLHCFFKDGNLVVREAQFLGDDRRVTPHANDVMSGIVITKLGRAGEVTDIMGAAVYLASDASALVTGTAMMIDGGWTAD